MRSDRSRALDGERSARQIPPARPPGPPADAVRCPAPPEKASPAAAARREVGRVPARSLGEKARAEPPKTASSPSRRLAVAESRKLRPHRRETSPAMMGSSQAVAGSAWPPVRSRRSSSSAPVGRAPRRNSHNGQRRQEIVSSSSGKWAWPVSLLLARGMRCLEQCLHRGGLSRDYSQRADRFARAPVP